MCSGSLRGFGLLSGSSINDIMTALSIFSGCSQYSTLLADHRRGDLLRQELSDTLPELTGRLTDEDIEWACGLTEAILESQEPVSANKRTTSRLRPVRNAIDSNKNQQTAQ
jgi:hypothetical protein